MGLGSDLGLGSHLGMGVDLALRSRGFLESSGSSAIDDRRWFWYGVSFSLCDSRSEGGFYD